MEEKVKRRSPSPYQEPEDKKKFLEEFFDKLECDYLGKPRFEKSGNYVFRAVRFRACGHEQDVCYTNGFRPNFSGFQCRQCLIDAKQSLFDKHGFEVITQITKDKFLVKKPCGHIAHAYTNSMKNSDKIVCSQCVHEKHLEACNALGVDYISSITAVKAVYKFKCCGTEKVLFRAAVDRGNCICPTCGSGWMSKPSNLYLFEMETKNGFKFLKFGYGKDLSNRVREYRLKDCELVSVICSVPMSSGFIAMKEEIRIHSELGEKLDQNEMKKYLTRGGYTECYEYSKLDMITSKMKELEEVTHG